VLGSDEAAVGIGDGRRVSTLRGWLVEDVDPVVRGVEAAGGEGAVGAIGINAIAAACAAGGGGEDTADGVASKEIAIVRIEAVAVIAGDIGGAGGDGDGGGEGRRLPAGGGLVGEGQAAQQLAGARPQAPRVGA